MGIFFVCLTATYSTTGYIWFGVTIISLIAFYRQKFTGASLFLILLATLSLYIANAGTTGFKASRGEFQDVVSTNLKGILGGNQLGRGVMLRAVTPILF